MTPEEQYTAGILLDLLRDMRNSLDNAADLANYLPHEFRIERRELLKLAELLHERTKALRKLIEKTGIDKV